MKKILSLDISSSTIGWALFEYDSSSSNLLKYGHFKPPNKKQSNNCLPLRLTAATNFLDNLLSTHNPNEVIIEDYAKRFSKGKSQASTIILLATFNEILGWTAYKYLGKDVHRIPVVTIRSVIGKHFNTKIVSKDDVFPVITKNCIIYKTHLNKAGNIKEECGDEVDAIACGMTWILKQSSNTLQWRI